MRVADRVRHATGTPRGRLALVAVPLVVLSVLGIAAAALTPWLVANAPLLLIALESRNRYLLLVSGKVDVVPFVVIGLLRRFASDPFYYLLGRWYGDRAVAWLARRTPGGGDVVGEVEQVFRRAAGPLVFLFPGALTCVLAGSAGMRPRRFVAWNLTGSLAAVVGLRLLADAAEGPLDALVAFNDRYAVPLTVAFVAVVLLWLVAGARGGRRPVDTLGDLETLERGGDDGDDGERDHEGGGEHDHEGGGEHDHEGGGERRDAPGAPGG